MPITLAFVAKHELTTLQGDRVLAALRRRIDVVHKGNVLAAARDIGKSQSALWQLLNGRTRPSFAMAQALATAMGCSVDTLLAGPRERAAELAREMGTAETAIARVLAEPDDGEIRPVLHYVDKMRLYEDLERLEAPGARKAG